MDAVNAWLLAVVALLPALAAPCWVALRGTTGDRFAAVQLATSVVTLMLVLMSFAFAQPSYLDLALALVLLALPGTLLFAHFLERWL
jgi:multisubunit Na+/H+ antiporter MnhF subunit